MNYNFDEINNRYNSGSYKYDRIKDSIPTVNDNSIIMTLADMDFKTAPNIIDSFVELSQKGIFGYMTEYFSPYQEAVKYWYRKNFSLDVLSEEIIYSPGTIIAIKEIIENFSKEDDFVCISRPVYGHFSVAIEQTGRSVKNINLLSKDNYYTFDLKALEEVLSDEKCSIYILCSPQNPTGRVWKPEELKDIVEICRKTNTLLISDEVHADIIREDVVHHPILKFCDKEDKVILISGIGKTFNLAGLQCSNMIIKNADIRNKIREFFDHDITTFAQTAVIAAYSNEGYEWKEALNKYIDENINFAVNFIKENMPYVNVLRPEGTYFLWLDFSNTGLSASEIHKRIYIDANVILQNGLSHDPTNGAMYERMPLGYPKSVVVEALNRIKESFKDIKEN